MRVTHITSTYPPYMGGTGNICFHLTNELLKSGVEVKVITIQTQGAYSNSDRTHVKRLRPLIKIGNAGWVPQALFMALKSDVIHFHYPFIGGEAALFVKLFKRKTRLVVSYHMDLYERGLKGFLFKLYQFVVLSLIKRLSDVTIFSSFDYGSSSALASYLQKYPERCRELPYGVDDNLFYPSNSINERLENQKIFFVAALDKAHSFKGLPILLQALVSLKTGRLVVAGDGDLRRYYQKLVADLKMENRVTFLGRVSDKDLAREFRTSKLFVLPSTTRSEAFGLVILEALSSGVPVVASNLPGVRAIISGGEDGFLVAPGNIKELSEKIRLLLDDSVLNERFGKAGRGKVIKKYSWPAIARVLLTEIYRLELQL